jgi:N-acetylmuramoyl-L-alanine amidase
MHVNWAVAVKLKALLEARGIAVVMTKRAEAERVTNRRRAEIANAAHAALFLRLHCDDGAGSGTATYYPDRQGESAGVKGPSRDVLRRSEEAARRFHPAMMARLRETFKDRGIRKESYSRVGAKQGALTGSIFSRVPALTVEMCLLSDRGDEKRAASEEGQELLAEGLERGVLAMVSPLKAEDSGATEGERTNKGG